MKRFILGIIPVLVLAFASVSVSSCGSTWEISGNNMEINVLDRDTTAVLPEGTQVMCVDTPSGSMKCYMIPQKSN